MDKKIEGRLYAYPLKTIKFINNLCVLMFEAYKLFIINYIRRIFDDQVDEVSI